MYACRWSAADDAVSWWDSRTTAIGRPKWCDCIRRCSSRYSDRDKWSALYRRLHSVASISRRCRPPSQLSFRWNFHGDQFSEPASCPCVPRRRWLRRLTVGAGRAIALPGGGGWLICGRLKGAGGPFIDWCSRRMPSKRPDGEVIEVARGRGRGNWTGLATNGRSTYTARTDCRTAAESWQLLRIINLHTYLLNLQRHFFTQIRLTCVALGYIELTS